MQNALDISKEKKAMDDGFRKTYQTKMGNG